MGKFIFARNKGAWSLAKRGVAPAAHGDGPAGRAPISNENESKPTLARRSANRHSTLKSGRTIGEQREKLETANERMAARQKDKRKKHFRVFFVSSGFLLLAAILAIIYFEFFHEDGHKLFTAPVEEITYTPTVEIIDEDAASGGSITNRMKDYIGQAEADFRSLGYHPIKAVVPTGTIREVDFYLEDYPGFIKMIIDRDTAVSVEDADRMIRYLVGQGITDFQYIDVRLSGKAYWK